MYVAPSSGYYDNPSDKKFGFGQRSLTTSQVARLIGTSEDYVRQKVRTGKWPCIKGFTRPYRIPVVFIEDLLGEKLADKLTALRAPQNANL